MYLEIIVWIDGLGIIDATFGPFLSKKEKDDLEADLKEVFRNSCPIISNSQEPPKGKAVMSVESARILLQMCKTLGT